MKNSSGSAESGRWVERLGFARSYIIAYGIPGWKWRLSKLYAPFIKKGMLCFDIGSHLGNRIPIWRKAGAKVVAVEPQPTLFEFLVKNYGKDENVVLLQGVVSSEVGTVTFYHNTRNPSLSTIDHSWIEEKKSDPTWGKYRWDREIEMSALTLDSLIGRYGVPDFCKIDVEGAELIVLSGLSVPINCLSFEYLTINKERSVRSIERIEELGRYEYNWTFSEFSALKSPSWLSAEQMISAINKMNGKSYSGDVYARLIERKR